MPDPTEEPTSAQIDRELLATLRAVRALTNLIGLYLMLPFAAILIVAVVGLGVWLRSVTE